MEEGNVLATQSVEFNEPIKQCISIIFPKIRYHNHVLLSIFARLLWKWKPIKKLINCDLKWEAKPIEQGECACN